MKLLSREILVGLIFVFGIAGIVLGEFIMSLLLFVTADILRGSKTHSIENKVA
jgi:hypothetical protein